MSNQQRIEELLKKSGLSLKEIVEIVNGIGNRNTDIVVHEICTECGTEWVGQVQDHKMREKLNFLPYCPPCKEKKDLERKRNRTRELRQKAKSTNVS
jgi:hypothetical protein